MRPAAKALAIAGIAGIALVPAAAAQSRIGFAAGAAGSTPLVKDSITQPITVQPRVGGSIAFWAETRLDTLYRVSVGLATSWSTLVRREGGASTSVVPLATWTPTISLDRKLVAGLSAYAAVGVIIYRADRTAANLFRRGSAPDPSVGGGLRYDRPLAAGLGLTARAGYDLHRFSTPSLRDQGIVGERNIHRVTASIGLSRGL